MAFAKASANISSSGASETRTHVTSPSCQNTCEEPPRS